MAQESQENPEVQQPEPFQWPPLESNPDVFNDYMCSVGLPKEWCVYQCFGFDEESLSFLP